MLRPASPRHRSAGNYGATVGKGSAGGRGAAGRGAQRGVNLRLLSRALFAVALAAVAAVVVRLRGTGGTPPHHGGWRELSVEDPSSSGPDSNGAGAPAPSGPSADVSKMVDRP